MNDSLAMATQRSIKILHRSQLNKTPPHHPDDVSLIHSGDLSSLNLNNTNNKPQTTTANRMIHS